MIDRYLANKLTSLAKQFPVLGIVGPRQSGKTTLAKALFTHLPYVSLEDLDQRAIAQNDPRWFLKKYADGAIIDEIQHVPEILSYLQTHVDQLQTPGRFVLTSSQNFIFSEKISQTLAGRIALLTLLPFSLEELKDTDLLPSSLEAILFTGCYPRIFDSSINPVDWYPNYIRTYIERDVRQIKNITDLNKFQTFIKLCAGRIGQILNLSSLANDCGVTSVTISHWLSLLEASYIVYRLFPYYRNFTKRLIKSPKLYFYDTGLACNLLGIENPNQLESHYLKGSLFENLVINEIIKFRLNQGLQPNVYFWRDKTGHEIDCLLDISPQIVPFEIKVAKTLSSHFFAHLQYFHDISETHQSFLVYDGEIEIRKNFTTVVNFKNLIKLLS